MKKHEKLSAQHLLQLQRAREMGWSLGVLLIPLFTIRFFFVLQSFGSVPTPFGMFLDWVNLLIAVGLVWVGTLCIAEAVRIGRALKDPAQLKSSELAARFLRGYHWVVVFPFYFRY